MPTVRRPTVPSFFAALRRGGRAFVWLAALLLAVNVFATALTRSPAVPAGVPPDAIEICTPHGMVWIDQQGHRIAPSGNTEPGKAQHGLQCQFCLPLMHGGCCSAAPSSPPLPSGGSVAAAMPVMIGAVVSAWELDPLQARAPPAP